MRRCLLMITRFAPLAFRLSAVLWCFLCACSDYFSPSPPPSPPTPVYPEHQDEPSWSSTGVIAYRDNGVTAVLVGGAYHTDSTLAGIWVVDPANGEKQRILGGGCYDPSWSPDGTRLAFCASAQIYTMAADGSDVTPLETRGRAFFPRWKPDGSAIVFDSDFDAETPLWNIRQISTGGGTDSLVALLPCAARMPCWSPNGELVAFTGYFSLASGQPSGIYRRDFDSLQVRPLRTQELEARYAVFSPDGNRIAYAGISSGGGPFQ